MNAVALGDLNGRVVLVYSQQDQRNPPSGRRGTLVVQQSGEQPACVEVDVEFPEMFITRAHRRRIRLSDEEVDRMLASEHYGSFTVRLAESLDPDAPRRNE